MDPVVSVTKSTGHYDGVRRALRLIEEQVKHDVKDKKKILPCAAYLEGEYGINGIYFGVPIKLGANGVEEIIEIDLTEEEKQAIKKSEAAVRNVIDLLKF